MNFPGHVLSPVPASNETTSSDDVIRCEGLTKTYGDFTALAGCSLTVRDGDVFGLLGPNGAGKTTLIRSLLGYIHPTSGTCQVLGCDPSRDSVEVRRRVSYLPGDARLPRHMRGRDALRLFSELHPSGDIFRCKRIAERLELDTSRRVAFMSTGMRQKLALAITFGLQTPILILDEPTANLDPSVRGQVLEMVKEAQTEGRTIVFSSHVLSEIEETCNRVVFLKNGRLARELWMSELFQRHRIVGKSNKAICVPEDLSDRINVIQSPPGSDEKQDVKIDTAGDLNQILSWVDSLSLSNIRIEPLGLRFVYNEVHRAKARS